MAVIVVWILAFILMCSMIFRSFALIVLAAVAPVALMLMPWEKTKTWARRWCEIVVALLLAKPLAATVLAVAIKLFADSKSFAGLAAGTVGMALACGAPLMALRLVSFAGGELAAAAQTAGGGHVLSRTSSFTARQISRQTGGRFTLAGMAGRSSMTRPIQSSRHQFPTRTLPAGAPLPGRPTGATPSSAPAGNAGALMLDAGTSAASPASPPGSSAQPRRSRAHRHREAEAAARPPASHHGRRRQATERRATDRPDGTACPSTSHESSSPQPTVIPMSETSRTLEAVKFPRYERRGLFMGLKWYQLLLLAAGVLVASLASASQGPVGLFASGPLWLALMLLGLLQYSRIPYPVWASHAVLFFYRSMAGQTRFLARPERAALAGRLALPGGLGNLEVRRTSRGECFIVDARGREAMAVLRCSTRSFALVRQ